MSDAPPTPPPPRAEFTVNLNDPAEIRYLKAMLIREFPEATPEAVNAAVEACRRQAEPFENRRELLNCARRHLQENP